MRRAQIISIFVLLTFFSSPGNAQEFGPQKSYLLAQNEGEDAYDPFADYSEFDGASEEEADINFFRHGRFFTLAFTFGYRRFTENLGEVYSASNFFGGYLTYFFDLRFALQIGYITGDHALSLPYGATGSLLGTTTISATSFHLKYFMNTQNVTKGLADLNPYLLGGFSQIYRTTRISGNDRYARDNAMSFDVGVGLEIPLMRHKMFLGLQGIYQFAKFQDENTEFTYRDDNDQVQSTGFFPRGDLIMGSALLGVNF
ncbi:MAG: hypothetical protein AB7F59_11685 [Bdellovibrionales bacterium]